MTDEKLDELIHKLNKHETAYLENYIKVFISGAKYREENPDTTYEQTARYATEQFLNINGIINR